MRQEGEKGQMSHIQYFGCLVMKWSKWQLTDILWKISQRIYKTKEAGSKCMFSLKNQEKARQEKSNKKG